MHHGVTPGPPRPPGCIIHIPWTWPIRDHRNHHSGPPELTGVNLVGTLCYSHIVRLGRPGGSRGPRWPRLSESWVVREDSEFCYLHPGVIPVGPVGPGLISGSSRVKTARKIQVLPAYSRCPPGVLPVFLDELGPPRYGAGVFQEDPSCRRITEPPWAHRGRRGVLFIFLFLLIVACMHFHVLKTYSNSHITKT